MNKIFIEAKHEKTAEYCFLKAILDKFFPEKEVDFICMGGISNLFKEFILNDYPQFALPLYNLCSNVGLYETAAITNRSNILSPKYLRLNL